MVKSRKILDNITPYNADKYQNNWRLKLDSNENIYGPCDKVINAIKNIDPKNISLYPAYGQLIDKFAVLYELKYENFLLTNGCDEAINLIISSYLESDEEIISYNPSFSMPQLYAQIAGGSVKLIDYDEEFVFSEKKVEQSISEKTKIIYIGTPNNPTGEVVKASVIAHLAQKFPDKLFLVDCTYINFSQSVEFLDYIDLIRSNDNIAVVKSFSKDYAMAGLRLGFICAKKEIIDTVKKIASPYNVNAAAVSCAMELIDSDEFEGIKQANIEAKECLYKALADFGYKPYPSEGNFILCDFGNYSDFYYEKFKNNGVIVRKFSKNSKISTCLRITVPKLGGVKYIIELLKIKDVLIFDLDGVVFDVTNSYMSAIKQTFKHFSNQDITTEDVMAVKNKGGMNCDWDATKCLLDQHGFNIEIKDVINVFQDLFYNPNDNTKKYLIDEEELLINKDIFEKLSQKYDLVVFSGRLKDEALYSLKKFNIDKYFYYYITCDDLPKYQLKPHPRGVEKILEHVPYKTIKYLGDSVDDIIAGNSAGVETIGVISPGSDYNVMKNNFTHLGANYIIDDIKNLNEFLGGINNEYAKNL